jgi:two-component system, OmpR family, phosphate regulon response regulator PhoB
MTTNIALVIEDDPDLSEIFSRALQKAGFEVESILDGKVAETRLKETIPNVIVLDMHLPNVDGPALLKQIRADERLSKARIIIATADSAKAEQYRSQATIVMIKPITFSSLRDISARLKGE